MKKNLFLLLSIICFTLAYDLSFASPPIVSLTPSNHNGYAVSCFGGRDGAITLTVSGGTSPYTFLWSSGETTQNVSALPAGFYQVTVTDAASATCSGNINLREPTVLTLSLTPSLYSPQNTNISCYNCCNGNISISASGGVTAYSYLWTSGQTTGNISSLCKNTYKLTLTDANGCTVVSTQVMTEPDKDAWAQSGNSGSNPSTQFIGTTDNVDLSFRTNNSERLRIKSNGNFEFNGRLKIDTASTDSVRSVYIDENGILKGIGSGGVDPLPDWHTKGNSIINDLDNFIGPTNGQDFVIKTFDPSVIGTGGLRERIRVSKYGTVYIGLASSSQVFQNSNDYKLLVGKMGATEMWCALGSSSSPWPDYVFKKDYNLKSLKDLEKYVKTENHLPGLPSAMEIAKQEKYNLGEMQIKLLEKTEENTLYILQLKNENDQMKKEIDQLKEENKVFKNLFPDKN